MDASKAVERATAAAEAAEAEVTQTRDERDAALRDAAASGVPKAQIARAAKMSRPQVVSIIQKGAGRASRGGDVLARVANSAAAARAARTARHEAVTARDALLAQVTDAGQLTAAEAARLAGVTPAVVSQARAAAKANAAS